MSRPFHFAIALCLTGTTVGQTGCLLDLLTGADGENDLEAELVLPSRLAQGGYAQIWMRDACGSSFFSRNGCEDEDMLEIADAASSRDGLEVLSPDDHELPGRSDQWLVYGAQPGIAQVSADAEFDDGSLRSADSEVEVVPIDEIRVTRQCPFGVQIESLAVHRGERIRLQGEWLARGEEVGGIVPGIVVADEWRGFGDEHHADFIVPDASTTIELRSEFLTDWSREILVFDESEVSRLVLERYGGERDWVVKYPGDEIVFEIRLDVDGETACGMQVEFENLSPDTCTIEADPSDGVASAFIHDDGECRFAAQMPSGAAREVFSRRVRVRRGR